MRTWAGAVSSRWGSLEVGVDGRGRGRVEVEVGVAVEVEVVVVVGGRGRGRLRRVMWRERRGLLRSEGARSRNGRDESIAPTAPTTADRATERTLRFCDFGGLSFSGRPASLLVVHPARRHVGRRGFVRWRGARCRHVALRAIAWRTCASRRPTGVTSGRDASSVLVAPSNRLRSWATLAPTLRARSPRSAPARNFRRGRRALLRSAGARERSSASAVSTELVERRQRWSMLERGGTAPASRARTLPASRGETERSWTTTS